MLNNDEKTRIQLEEAYRHEVRSQLAPRSDGRVWTFLNSALGLWLLSVLFVTGVGSLYTKYQEARAETERVGGQVERLDLELGYRFSQLQGKLAGVADSKPPDVEAQVASIVDSVPKPPAGSFEHLYPEHASFSIPALVAELRRLVSDDRERAELEKLLAHLTGLQVFFQVREAPFSDPTRVAGAIIKDLVLPRWKDSRWYFLDGRPDSPFP